MLLCFSPGIFRDDLKPTIGADFATKQITFSGKQYQLQLWDIAGYCRSDYTVAHQCYKSADGIIIPFCLSQCARDNEKTIQSVIEWREMSLSVLPVQVPCILVGTKSDLSQNGEEITESLWSLLDPDLNIHMWFATSAKTGRNVDLLFNQLMLMMVENKRKRE